MPTTTTKARTRRRLSPHFTIEEFDCKDGSKVRSSHADAFEYLASELLEPLRQRFGRCTVVSGYRTPGHNRAVGGARNSFHVNDFHDGDDVACDVRFAKGSVTQWHQAAEQLLSQKRNGKGGLGKYVRGGFIHIDTRDYESRWEGP